VDVEGVVIAGHTRLAAARSLGMTEVPVIVCEGLSPEQVRALRLADNQVASLSTWEERLLFKELSELRAAEVDWSTLGFSSVELDRLLAPEPVEGHTDPDAVPPTPETSVSLPETV
jgi:site-specific DNA-methyltransferase (adenine-specific)